MIGILPTLRRGAPDRRGAVGQPALRAAQRADLRRPRRGPAHRDRRRRAAVARYADTITPEAACTSVQLHLQVDPERSSPRYWNAAQAIAGVQVALGANSPFLFGRELWRETRIAAVRAGHRHPAGGAQGPGRAPAGVVRRALDHLDLRPVRGERALLPGAAAAAATTRTRAAVLERRRARSSAELRLHNGTIYRWNRPVYDVVARPAAPAGREPGAAGRARRWSTSSPTPPSTTAWSGRWPRRTGRCGRRCRSARPRRTSTPAPGTASTPDVYWPGLGEVPVTELVLRRLLPMAAPRAGRAGASTPADRDRLLGIIEQRCLTGRNGASWQAAALPPLLRRAQARAAWTRCATMTLRYRELMHENLPVHEWPVGS